MKLRHGFVSNSSSTSFSIYGVCFNNNEDTLQEAMLPEMFDLINSMPAPDKWSDEFSDKLEKYFSDLKLSVVTGQDSEYIYIGREWPDEDETPRQLKTRIQETLEKVFKPGFAVGGHEESWFDG